MRIEHIIHEGNKIYLFTKDCEKDVEELKKDYKASLCNYHFKGGLYTGIVLIFKNSEEAEKELLKFKK